MATIGAKGQKPDYSYFLAETQQDTTNYTRTLNFNGGSGVYRIQIFDKQNTYSTSRSLQGGIKFLDAFGNDSTVDWSNVMHYSGSFAYSNGTDIGTNWWGDDDIWIPHSWWPSTSIAPRPVPRPIVYDLIVRSYAGKSTISGIKMMVNASDYAYGQNLLGRCPDTNPPRQIVIDRYENFYWTDLTMTATRIGDVEV